MTSSKNSEAPTSAATSSSSKWPALANLPDESPTVILVFHGLMGLAYNDLGFCEVGIHCKAPKHQFRVSVYDKLSSVTDPMYKYNFGSAQDSPVNIIRLDIKDPLELKESKVKGVNFYMPTISEGSGDADKDVANELDFRLIADLESEKFYGRPLQKKPEAFKPKLYVKHGVFVTLAPSKYGFKSVAPHEDKDIGKIAEFIGTAIYLKKDGYVSLRIGQEELKLMAGKDRFYLIVFDNSCSQASCDFVPSSPIKEKRNDFYLYSQTFVIPDDLEEYELVPADTSLQPSAKVERANTANTAAAVKVFNTFSPLLENVLEDIRSNNEAPCGAAGYGQSNGLQVS